MAAGMDRDAIVAEVRLVTLIPSGEVSDNNVVQLIKNGAEEVALATQWPWLEASETLTLSSGTQTYSLPSTFEYMMALVDDDNDRTIPYIAPSTFFNFYGNDTGNTSTTPMFYTIWEEKFYITPTPSTNDTNRLKVYFYKSVTQMNTGTDLPEWNPAFHHILVEYVKWKLYERAEYYEQGNRAFSTYKLYLQEMMTWYTRRAKTMPAIYGDGIFRPRSGDPNVILLNN